MSSESRSKLFSLAIIVDVTKTRTGPKTGPQNGLSFQMYKFGERDLVPYQGDGRGKLR